MTPLISWRSALASLAIAAAVALGGAGQAAAAQPWWHLATIAGPASPNNSEAKIELVVANLGDGPTSGTLQGHLEEAALAGETKGFITVVDKLPPGVTPTGVRPHGGGTSFAWGGEKGLEEELDLYEQFFGLKPPKLCSISGQTVECKYGTPVRPYEQIMLAINAKVAPGAGNGENEVDVSGGGAAPLTSRRPLAVDAPRPYGVQAYELTPEEEGGIPNTQAGSHPFQLTTTLLFNTQSVGGVHGALIEQGEPEGGNNHSELQPLAMTKDVRFKLPPGLVGNPTPLPKCSVRQFLSYFGSEGKEMCPDDTVVGVATTITTSFQYANFPLVISEPLYILEPSAGEPAKFGFPTLVGPVILDTSVRTGGDYGVVVTVPNITQQVAFIGNIVTFWGVPGDPRHDNSRNVKCISATESAQTGGPEELCPTSEKAQPLLITPTSCTGPLRTTVETDSWSQIGRFTEPFDYTFQNGQGEPIGQDGCNRLNFEPSISVAPDGQEGSSPTGLTVGVHVPQEASQNPEGLAESTVKATEVTLPAGVSLNPAGADGLMSCGLGEIGLEDAAEQSCPEAAKVGTVEIRTPLLPNPLTGAVYLAEQDANPFGSLIALYIVARDPVSGVLVKLAGQVTPDPVTGQLVSTFKDTPQLPFEDLRLHFFGGSRAPLGTPALCGSYTTTASIAPWSGNASAQSSSEFAITSGPNHTPCSNPLPFHPTLNAGSTNIQTGGYTQLTTTMGREDGEQNLQAIQLHFPEGLIGSLSQVGLCGEPQADEGACPADSQIGETTVSVGLGGNPYTVTGGQVFITGPYDGAPFGLSIVNPAKAGPFDLGKVVVRARVEVNPITSALTVTTDPSGPYAIPHILDGIPLAIKHVNVLIDRSKFVFNPSNCTPTAITATLSSDEGSSSDVSTPFQVTNCATLKFKPKFAVSTPGKTSRTNGTSLAVKLTYPVEEGQANIAKVKVELPKQLPARLPTLQKACTEAAFDRNPESCPATSRVGEAVATTPTISGVFTGPAYFVSRGGAAWPELIVVLKGEDGVTVDLHGETHINKQGVTSSTFNTVPDVPVGSFELKLPAGQYSALTANGANLCGKKLTMPTEFVAQNGDVIRQNTKVATTGCPKAKKAHHKKKPARHRRKRLAEGIKKKG